MTKAPVVIPHRILATIAEVRGHIVGIVGTRFNKHYFPPRVL